MHQLQGRCVHSVSRALPRGTICTIDIKGLYIMTISDSWQSSAQSKVGGATFS